MRKRFIAGNWKMNGGPKETNDFFEALSQMYFQEQRLIDAIGSGEAEIVIFPPCVSIFSAMASRGNAPFYIGAQNAYFEKNGAFTGEISMPMFKEAGCSHVLVGHSERRHIFGEQNDLLHKKVLAALDEALTPVLCVGELLEERESGKTFDVIETQLAVALEDIDPCVLGEDIIIAYEPVWAIGTGKTARDEDAQEVCSFIRGYVREHFGGEAAERVRILYGGSVKPENTKGIMSQPDIDGVLVGGASLKPNSFLSIIRNSIF